MVTCMKVLLSWLREFAPSTTTPAAIGDTLSTTSARRSRRWSVVGDGLDGIVVARVLERCGPIPTPTGSSWSTSTPATARRSRSCCGAFNMAVGDLVPLATSAR